MLLAFGVTTFYILGCWYKRVVLNIGLLIFEASLVFSFNVCIAKRLYQSIDLLAVTNLWSVMYAGRVKGLGQRSSELFYFFLKLRFIPICSASLHFWIGAYHTFFLLLFHTFAPFILLKVY